MHLYNTKIIKSEEATQKVSDYNAKKIQHDVPRQIHRTNDFSAEYTGNSGSFRMDELLQERTGIGEKRQREVMEKVEESVISKLKEVEEEAYQKAYNLGLEEGRTEGLKNAETMVAAKLMSLDLAMTELADLRKSLVVENEAMIVKLSYQLGSKIALRNIEEDPGYIMDCVRELIDSMQSDNQVTLKVSDEDFAFIEEFKDRDLKTKDLFSRVKLYKEEGLEHGECILESNHGVVNATLEERLKKVWNTISENIPKIEDAGGSSSAIRATTEIPSETPQEEIPVEEPQTEEENFEMSSVSDEVQQTEEAQDSSLNEDLSVIEDSELDGNEDNKDEDSE